MKKTILILLFMLMINNSYAQDLEGSFENHAFRPYVSIGYGTQALNGGGGLSYTYEFGEIDSKKFMGFSIDAQVGSIGSNNRDFFNRMFFNVQSSVGTGIRYKDGSRFYFDILGIGYSLVNLSRSIEINGNYGYETVIKNSTMTGFLLNFMSFHLTTKTGLYFSWRNNFIMYSRANATYIYESTVVEKRKNASFDFGFEYRTYITFGFDFSKIYSPKNYQKRAF